MLTITSPPLKGAGGMFIIGKSTHRQIAKSTHRQINSSSNRQIVKSPNLLIC